jgi:hypothetical protein
MRRIVAERSAEIICSRFSPRFDATVGQDATDGNYGVAIYRFSRVPKTRYYAREKVGYFSALSEILGTIRLLHILTRKKGRYRPSHKWL